MDAVQQTLQTFHEDYRNQYRWFQDRSLPDKNKGHERENRSCYLITPRRRESYREGQSAARKTKSYD